MEENLISAAAEQGIWAFISITLLFYILKKQEKRDEQQAEREERYQQLIAELSQKFNIVFQMKNDISEIKAKIHTDENAK